MKKRIALLSILFALTAFAQAQPADGFFKKVQKQYSKSLAFENQGVVESAIVQLIVMKLRYPDLKMTKIEDDLRHLVLQGETSDLRYKAFVALYVLQNPRSINFDIKNLEDNEVAYLTVKTVLERQFMAIPEFAATGN
ncbi:MAG: hypothetical protein KDI06_10715 [Calditrichaeota bacterium]|nr:hypothetical protein [Calditrichota bacterium]HQU74445.1 hypothetical protein [Calditrichia bacterium]